MSIKTITDTETRLTNTLRTTTEALKQVTAERDALHAAMCGLQDIAVKAELERDEYQRAVDTMAAAHKVEMDGLHRTLEQALEALQILSCEADSFSVSGVYFNESCMGHKGLDMAETAITAIQEHLK